MITEVAKLLATFARYLAQFAVREAAWMTVDAASSRMKSRKRAVESGYNPRWVTYEGPAGHRREEL